MKLTEVKLKDKVIDITPFFCEALASNKSIHKLIEKTYDSNRVYYYQLAKKSKFYNHEIITAQSIQAEIVGKRALALILDSNDEAIFTIFKKGWKSIFNHIKNNDRILMSNIFFQTAESVELLCSYTTDQISSWFIATTALSKFLNKTVDENDDMYIQWFLKYEKELRAVNERKDFLSSIVFFP